MPNTGTHHEKVSWGTRTARQVCKLVDVMRKLPPVVQANWRGQVRAGLILDQQGVAQEGDHIYNLSQQDPVRGVPIIHLQHTQSPHLDYINMCLLLAHDAEGMADS